MFTAYLAYLEAQTKIDYDVVYLGTFIVDCLMWYTIYDIFM